MSGWAPCVQTWAPDEYPEPAPGDVTTWALRTPEGEPVGTLTFNEGGVSWRFALTEDDSAQEHGAEILQLLRTMRAEGVELASVLAMIKAAYEGDLDET